MNTSRKSQPLVTIVTPSYNHARYVCDAIESVIAQDYPNIEYLVIDDGSSDDSVARIERVLDRCHTRFQRFEFRPRQNRGLCETLNEALQWARGDYLAVLDSDDILLPQKTSTLVDLLENEPKLAGVFSGCHVVNADGDRLNMISPPTRVYEFRDILARDKNFVSSSMLVRLDEVRRTGGYVPGLYIEDWYMWLRLTEGGATLKVIPDPLILYRQHGTNISRDAVKMFNARKQILEMYPDRKETPQALATIWLELAVELRRKSRADAFKCLATALRHSPSAALSLLFWTTSARSISPVFLLDYMSSLKKRRRASAS
jgi:alpha-1,3-rhamnosyltransferase